MRFKPEFNMTKNSLEISQGKNRHIYSKIEIVELSQITS